MQKEDIYLIMLRFGKGKLESGFVIEDLLDYLNKNGFERMSISSTIFYQYFHKVFFSKDNQTTYPPHHSSRFYLRPECYMQLLEHDNMVAARKEAKETRLYAIIAILLALGSVVVSIFK